MLATGCPVYAGLCLFWSFISLGYIVHTANLIYKQALHEAALKETEVADPTAVPAMLAAVHPFQLAFNVISLQKVSLLSVLA